MSYEAMWMCSSMPHPDDTQGTLNIDLKNNSIISLYNEFIDAKAQQAFTSMVVKRLNQKITEVSKASQMECPAANEIGQFFISQTDLVVSNSATAYFSFTKFLDSFL